MKVTARALVVGWMIVAVSSGCARPTSGSGWAPTEVGAEQTTSASVEVTDSNGMRSGVFPSTWVEPPSDADRPDGPPPVPDSDLTITDLAGLLRSSASVTSTMKSCTVGWVRLLTDAESITGHRYAQLIATNASSESCQLTGWPGVGLRGAWGTPFPVIAERRTSEVNRVGMPEPDPDVAVTLSPGGRAAAEFEWTGALAGNRDEHTSMMVVQLAADQDPVRLIIDPVDIGSDTTVEVGPWGRVG